MTQEQKMNQKCGLRPGQIVRSKAGRDQAGVFLVLEILDAKHVTIVDGHRHKLSNPKKKRVIHLQPFRAIVEDFETMKAERTFNDARIRKIIEPYKVTEEEANHVD